MLTLFLLAAVAVVLSGCGHYDMGRRYTNDMHYDQSHNQSENDSLYMQGNNMQLNGPYER